MRDGLIDELVENWLLLDQEDIEDVARVNKTSTCKKTQRKQTA